MSKTATEFTTAPGRFVFGDLYEAETEDFDGNRMVIKNGPDKGKETQMYIIGLAIPKTKGHWGSEPGWGEIIWAAGHAAFPGGEAQRPDFSWKIEDGDSQVIRPKSKSKVRPCDREGWKGCWILRLHSSFAPNVFDALANIENPKPLDTVGAVVPGYVIQVVGTVKGNTGSSPGVYLNHNAVGLRAYLPVIKTKGVDVAGKFGGALPVGASTLPAPVSTIPAAPAAPAPAAAAPPAIPAAPAAPAPAVPPTPTAVVPAPAIFGIPTAPLPPSAPPAPAAAPPPPVSRPPHKGIPVESYLANGWTIEQLRADGYAG